MFQETIIEIIKRIENLKQKTISIVELDIVDIKEQIEDTLFKINFTPDTIEDIDQEELNELNVTVKEALGLFFLSYVATLRFELSYNSLWIDICDALMEREEEGNRFFIENFFYDDSHPDEFLSEAINDAIARFNLRNSYYETAPTNTVLLQMGILKRLKNLNYWLTSTSRNTTIQDLTNRASKNFSASFNSGWKLLQEYSQNSIEKKDAKKQLETNVWFKDFDIDELLSSSKVNLHTPLISKDKIEGNFFLEKVQFIDEKLHFTINGDDFYTLNLINKSYDIYVDGKLQSELIDGKLEETITIKEPENYKVTIEIKDETKNTIYSEEFILFDFNHDILIFDEDGNYTKEPNQKLDKSKTYSMLIDSDFEVESKEDEVYEYFDGYVNLITNITKDSNTSVDDGDEYQFTLNFDNDITTPAWLNNIELFATTDFLEIDQAIKYQLKYNKLAISVRQSDELVDIEEEAKIVRWSYNGGVVYDLEDIENFTYSMDLTEDILVDRKNTLKIKVGEHIYTKQLNVTLLEQTQKPIYRTFLKDSDDYIKPLRGSNKLTSDDIKNNQIIITSYHEEFINNPESKTQILRDKASVYGKVELNKFFKLDNYPYYGDEISSAKKVYDDVHWNTFCCVEVNGIVKSFDEATNKATLYENDLSNLTLIVLDKSYSLSTKQLNITSSKIDIPKDTLGFCLVQDGNYVGSHFIEQDLDIETVFTNIEVLKFLRASYYPFGEYFNSVEYESNRAQREKARNDKKKQKTLLRNCVKKNIALFLDAFVSEEFTIEDTSINLNFEHSKTIVEQILFVIPFDESEALSIVREIILNRWQDKILGFPLFLVYILNVMNSDKYYQIFLDELSSDIKEPSDMDEEFIQRMITAILSNHKIDGFEKINIKTITQTTHRDFFIKKAIDGLVEKNERLLALETAEEE